MGSGLPNKIFQISIDSGVRSALGKFNIAELEITGGNFSAPNFQASGFFFRVTEQTATITFSAFDETTEPEIPAEDALEGIEEFTFTLQPGLGDAIASSDSVAVLPHRIALRLATFCHLTIFELPVKTKPWMVSMLWSALSEQDEANRWLRDTIKTISRKIETS